MAAELPPRHDDRSAPSGREPIRIGRRAASLALMALATAPMRIAWAQSRSPVVVPFNAGQPGGLPPGFTSALTGRGAPARWQVLDDTSVPAGRVLAQTSADPTDERYPLCIYEPASLGDVDLSVRIKPISGRVDRAGGLIVRVQDASNYYVVRANALEDNVRLYRVVNGRRIQFAGANARVQAGVWQTLRIVAAGSRFSVSFNDRPLFDAMDAAIRQPGRIGMWTKADSVTHFDQLQYA